MSITMWIIFSIVFNLLLNFILYEINEKYMPDHYSEMYIMFIPYPIMGTIFLLWIIIHNLRYKKYRK